MSKEQKGKVNLLLKVTEIPALLDEVTESVNLT